MFGGVFYFGDVFGSVFNYGDVLGSAFFWWCVWITQKQVAKFEALIVCGVLGSVFDIGDVSGSMFDVGDVFGSTSDVNKPAICLHI